MWEKRAVNAILGLSLTYAYAPALDGTGASGTTLTTGAGAWGAYADLAAAKAITTEFWCCGMAVYTANGAQVFHLQLYDATLTATIASFLLDPTAVTLNAVPMLLPYPIYRAANTQIQGRGGGAAAKTIVAHLIYAIGL
ncbi:MAG: hypothetical protein PHG61_03340 [Candidatus Marinimicrobia bacterium]|jgi:hypothetical protein|nr:hypothetical protein [Candidatus Neomarinimicrobiota bacterium]